MTTDDAHPVPARPAKSWYDMGGDPAGPVLPEEHDYALWEKRVDALVVLCQKKGLFTVDGLRRALEDMGPEAFETLTYYERWVGALRRNLVEVGAITPAELEAAMEAVRTRGDTYGTASEPPAHE
ncbi:ScnB-like protein [Tropicimonas sp. S265A]|uniref:ScnB-like protein n=1 Tax=Tropicimonas sp. S265A TaxID=3415134 RepID=UPI003C7D0E9B